MTLFKIRYDGWLVRSGEGFKKLLQCCIAIAVLCSINNEFFVATVVVFLVYPHIIRYQRYVLLDMWSHRPILWLCINEPREHDPAVWTQC